jgi:mRNA interferase MazF
MPSTTSYRRGDIVLVSFPFTDLSAAKRRPALVVSPDSFNAATSDLVLAAVTSQISEDTPLIIVESDCVDGTLPKTSALKPTKLFTIHSTLVIRKVCAIRREKLDAVLDDLRQFFSPAAEGPEKASGAETG